MAKNIDTLRLEFRDIEYVTMITQCQSITKAADKLHITQPALSIYIKGLEERIGMQLFNRIGKKYILTNAGECIIQHGAELLQIRNNIQKQLDDIKNNERGLIRIGFTPIRGIMFLPVMLNSFQEKNPNVEIISVEQSAQELEKMVLDGTLDISFFNKVSETDKIVYEEIVSDPVVLFLSESLAEKMNTINKPEFQHPWIDLMDVADMPFIRNYSNQNTEQITQQILEDYQISPPTLTQVGNQLTAINLAAYGNGIYLAPEYFSYNMTFRKSPAILSFGPTPAKYNLSFVAATAKGAYRSAQINDFINMAKDLYTYKVFPGFEAF